ncbi:MAG: PIN domain-containing protein [Verrucomicrobiota bacterium]
MVDYENLQPVNLHLLKNDSVKIIVFLGVSQKAPATWEKAEGIECIRISGNGKNALDFHIAYHIGIISTANPQARFQIVSKDKGYDPLICHIRERGGNVSRTKKLSVPTRGKVVPQDLLDRQLASVLRNLQKNGANRPKTFKKLISTIDSWFQQRMGQAEAYDLVGKLQKMGCLLISNNRITYVL